MWICENAGVAASTQVKAAKEDAKCHDLPLSGADRLGSLLGNAASPI